MGTEPTTVMRAGDTSCVIVPTISLRNMEVNGQDVSMQNCLLVVRVQLPSIWIWNRCQHPRLRRLRVGEILLACMVPHLPPRFLEQKESQFICLRRRHRIYSLNYHRGWRGRLVEFQTRGGWHKLRRRYSIIIHSIHGHQRGKVTSYRRGDYKRDKYFPEFLEE